ncbi:MAG: DUF4350 domain-containing protein [Croceibacterium sp.]
MTGAAASPFSPRMVLAMLVVGAGAFLLCLYAIGQGWTGQHDDTGGSGHAASNGLNGYAALVRLLEKRGYPVSTTRDRARLDDRALLILTPPLTQNAAELSELLRKRRFEGPTIVILPKWFAFDASKVPGIKGAKPGWVLLGDPTSPTWLSKVVAIEHTEISLDHEGRWTGLGHTGALPTAKAQSIFGPNLAPLVSDGHGALVAYAEDGGSYPTLQPLAGRTVVQLRESDENSYALVIVAEPDLVNNLGLADQGRARLAVQLVGASLENQKLPVVFDLTLAGLGASDNLLKLAFEPPFLAATLCLLLAALVVAWRGLRRFGPPLAEEPALGHGKRQLARNGAGLIERSRRLHLLGPPYAALIAGRIAARLGLREAAPEARDLAAARLLEARGLAADYPARLAALRGARRSTDLLRAAGALKSIERTLAP